ncbi:hypothetical protein F383_07691 [Gossypium arboreum]|uniref:Uncharacterized protein n=1 Tax=Gossypium arboreum TaxID=29729 RepID=A0A0B0P931_GOSAR|nr:hypothetical protein F383_07691 [Gossypium arboreum]
MILAQGPFRPDRPQRATKYSTLNAGTVLEHPGHSLKIWSMFSSATPHLG